MLQGARNSDSGFGSDCIVDGCELDAGDDYEKHFGRALIGLAVAPIGLAVLFALHDVGLTRAVIRWCQRGKLPTRVRRAWTSKATKERKMSAAVVTTWQETVAEKQAAKATSSPSWAPVAKVAGAPAPVSIADLRSASLADRLPVDAADAFRELDVWSDVDLRSEVDATDFDVEQAAETSRPPSRIGDGAVVFM